MKLNRAKRRYLMGWPDSIIGVCRPEIIRAD